MCFEICPDLGFYLLKKFGQNKPHYFYNIPIKDIINTGDGNLTFTAYPTFDNTVFAVSFDFSNQHLLATLICSGSKYLSEEVKRILNNPELIPEKIIISDTPILADIKAKIGKPVQGKYEVFVPLVVEHMTLVAENLN